MPGGVRDHRSPGLGLRGPCWHTSWCRPRSPCLRFMLRRSVARVNDRPRRSPNSPKAVLVLTAPIKCMAVPLGLVSQVASGRFHLTPTPSTPENNLDSSQSPGQLLARSDRLRRSPAVVRIVRHRRARRPLRGLSDVAKSPASAHSVMGAGSLPVDPADGSARSRPARTTTSSCTGWRGPHAAQGVGVASEAALSAPVPPNSPLATTRPSCAWRWLVCHAG